MRIYIIIIGFLLQLFTSNGLLGQHSCAKITYSCQTTATNGKGYNGQNTLHFNSKEGLFIHNNYPAESSFREIGTTLSHIKGDPEGLPVYMNLKDRYLHYKSTYSTNDPGDNFIFKEDLPKIDWVIGNRSKKIGDFNCLPATGEFGGRTYDVWFTPDIPVSLGPYKLHGLPGMILEAVAQDAKVSYHFASYESPCDVEIEKPSKGKEMTWEELESHVIAKLHKVESMSYPGVEMTLSPTPADYEIERNKFTIISEYKRKREEKKGQRQ